MKMVWISGSFRIGNSDGIGDGGIGNIGGAIGIESDGIGSFDGKNGIDNNIGVSGIGWWLGWEKKCGINDHLNDIKTIWSISYTFQRYNYVCN